MRRIALHAVPCQTTRQKQTKRGKFNATGSTAFHRLFDGVWCSETAFGNRETLSETAFGCQIVDFERFILRRGRVLSYPQGWGVFREIWGYQSVVRRLYPMVLFLGAGCFVRRTMRGGICPRRHFLTLWSGLDNIHDQVPEH